MILKRLFSDNCPFLNFRSYFKNYAYFGKTLFGENVWFEKMHIS